MKSHRKIIVFLVVIVLTFNASITFTGNNVKATGVFQIISPSGDYLVPAGPIDIEWTSASGAGSVKENQVYVDGKLEYTTSNTSCRIYNTKVNYHTVFIVACYTDGDRTSTENVRFGVSKKGLCVNKDMGKYLSPVNMGASWYYNWGVAPFSFPAYSATDFVPMIWGTASENNITSIASKGYKFLLAYNEPDMPMRDQYGNYIGGSNVAVGTAISHWSKFTGHNFYLGAPAPAQSPTWGIANNTGGKWFRTFMNGIDQSTVDFIPLHCYYETWGGEAAAKAFLTDLVDKAYEMYHKPIWITEFAPNGWDYNNANGRKQCKEFLEAVLKGLDERSYVERYSWFSFDTTDTRNGAAALWTNSTGELTELGQAYVDNGNPKTDYVAGNVTNTYSRQKAPVKQQPYSNRVRKPARVKIKSAKNLKGKKVKLTFKKVSKAVGYQIKASDSKKFKGYWTKNTKKTSYTFKKLDKNTRYYFKVRAYVKKGNSKLYGAWSKAKNVKVKK